MRMRILRLFFIWLFFVLCAHPSNAQTDSAKILIGGQVATWGVCQFSSALPTQLGARLIPTATGHLSKFDFEASLVINGLIGFNGMRRDTLFGQLKPYRVWTRYTGQNWELRVGLQKINFGSAKLFRPLMWFDGMDVRDPLQLTEGVYGLLGKYFFENNANLWTWGLIGNAKTKGWEFFATEQWKPEFGGRIQLPLLRGEIAMSTNYRKIRATGFTVVNEPEGVLLNESRVGIDGKWDLGIGLWFEGSSTFTQRNDIEVFRYQDMWNFGVDYTLPVGSGLGVTFEYLRFHGGNRYLLGGTSLSLIGSMFNYSISILDNLTAMVYYVPGNKTIYNYFSWSRTYDNLSLYAIGFWNPTTSLSIAKPTGSNLFAGKGLQLMLTYNF